MVAYMDALRIELNELLKKHTYERVAEMFCTDEVIINKGIVWKMANTDYEPKSEEIRTAFGFPERITIDIVRDEKGRFS